MQQAEGDQQKFRAALGRFATGVTVVVAPSESGPTAITANSFSSVSLNPPLVLWSPAKSSRRHDVFCAAAHFSIYVLTADQTHIAQTFARAPFVFDPADWEVSSNGSLPRLRSFTARFACRRHAVYEGGDHSIILGEVTGFDTKNHAPLMFLGGKFGDFAQQL